jgi:hypothetical protein
MSEGPEFREQYSEVMDEMKDFPVDMLGNFRHGIMMIMMCIVWSRINRSSCFLHSDVSKYGRNSNLC